MKLSRFKHLLLRLNTEEKIIGAAGIVVILSTFLPWYSVKFLNEQSLTVSGFAGDLGVIGFVVFLLSALAITVLISDHIKLKIPLFGYKKDTASLFLMGEGAFLLLITVAIYTKRTFEYTNAELRFGLYLTLIAAFIGTFAAFSQIQKKAKKNVEEFFAHEEEAEEVVNEPNMEAEYPPMKNEESKVEKEVESEPPQQEKFFYEEPEVEESEIVAEAEEPNEEEIGAENVDEEVKEQVEEEIIEKEHKIADQPEQGPYFAKEAGIKVDMDSVKRVNEEAVEEESSKAESEKEVVAASSEPEEKEKKEESGGFYDDF
jgi:hypothetical protein